MKTRHRNSPAETEANIAAICRFMEDYVATHQVAPLYREVGDHLGMDRKTIQYHVDRLRSGNRLSPAVLDAIAHQRRRTGNPNFGMHSPRCKPEVARAIVNLLLTDGAACDRLYNFRHGGTDEH